MNCIIRTGNESGKENGAVELLKGRPMAYAGIAALTAAAIGWYFNGTVKLCLAAAALVSLAVWSILRIARVASGRIASRGILASAAALLVLLGAFRFYDIKYLGAQELCGSEHEFAVRILGRRDGGYGSGFDIRITEADGTAMSVRARLTVEGTADFRAGNTVRLRCTPVPFEKTPSYDGERAALADGILLELTADEDVAYVMTDTSEAGGLLGFFSRLGSDLSFRLREAVGGDEGALAAAMLLGDRSGLPDAAARDFSRAGVSHLLALSGLHLSAVAGAVGWLLTKLRLPKLAKTPLMSVFLLLYLAVVGFPLSAVRAAIMLFAVFAAYYSGADGDGVSSVFLASAIILTVSPAAVADIGFMLSFSATLGITVFLPAYNRRKAKVSRDAGHMRRLISSTFGKAGALLLTGLAANCFTAIIIWRVFGSISLAAPLTNLFLTPLAGPLLALSAAALLLDGIPFFGSASALGARLAARVILRSCERVSDIHGAVLPLGLEFTPYILASAAVLTLVLLIIKLNHPAVCFVPAAAAVAAFAVCFAASGTFDRTGSVSVGCVSRGGNEAIYVSSCGGCAVIDVGSGSYGVLHDAVSAAKAAGATETEALVLTHYHQRHTASVARLCGREKVRRVWLPYPQNSEEAGIMSRIYEAAAAAGAECSVYMPGEALVCFGDVAIASSGPAALGRSTHPVIRLTVDAGERGGRTEYIGASAWEVPSCSGAADADTVIYGAHGPKIKSLCAVPVSDRTGEIVFCSHDAAYAAVGGAGKAMLEHTEATKFTLMPELWKNDP